MTTKHTTRYQPSIKDTEIHLIRGQSVEGLPTYTYLAVYAHRVRDLKLSLMTKTTDLEKFGVILKTGIGEPDAATKKYIQETYVFEKIDSDTNTEN